MNIVWHMLSLASGGRVTTRLRARRKALYLTFDDGPHAQNTPEVLSVLERNGARATFFLVGEQVQRHQDLVRALVDAGHRLGNHSFSHRKLETLSVAEMLEELARTDAALAAVDGENQHLIRPPWGRITAPQLLRCLAAGRRIALWSRDSQDYKDGAEAIVRRFRGAPPDSGDVLLFHDDGPAASGALAELLPEWKSAGFDFEPMPPG